VLGRALESLSQHFEQRKIVAKRGPLEPAMVRADARALEQVLVNLLENAGKYTEPGGRVEVRAGPVGDMVRVSVEDTGIGIPEAHLARIFERFYRVDKARSRALGGTGLGLSIVRHLVESMGGHVSVESTPGKGSVFHFTLRRA
jgi:two-component system phosphate regulon sensor histidine kinase PhoR